jgi:hypothetical protein
MTTGVAAAEFLAEVISQLFHADVLITEQAGRIDVLEADVDRLGAALAEASGAAASAARPSASRLLGAAAQRQSGLAVGRAAPGKGTTPGLR